MNQPNDRQNLLRNRVRTLLENKEVVAALGYRAGTLPGTAVPWLARKPEHADKLVWNENCLANLAVYLPRLKKLGRLAIVASGPTSRSLVNLLKENQIRRENLYIIGIAGLVPSAPTSTAEPKTLFGTPNPVIYDEMIGEKAPEPEQPDDYADIVAFEKLPSEERWRILREELSRCIRCYACRQVCPNCYCPNCFVDVSQPQWVGRTPDDSDTVIFHIMRAMHMAGRCVECGACARACPMGINLMRLNRKVALIVKSRFGHVSGMKLDEPLPLASFRTDDGQEFIK